MGKLWMSPLFVSDVTHSHTFYQEHNYQPSAHSAGKNQCVNIQLMQTYMYVGKVKFQLYNRSAWLAVLESANSAILWCASNFVMCSQLVVHSSLSFEERMTCTSHSMYMWRYRIA